MMAFVGQDPIRCKIMANKCLQPKKSFKYLICEICYENKKDIQQKVAKFAQILGILNNTFKPNLFAKFSRIKVYIALVVPILLYRSKIGPLEKGQKNYQYHSR